MISNGFYLMKDLEKPSLEDGKPLWSLQNQSFHWYNSRTHFVGATAWNTVSSQQAPVFIVVFVFTPVFCVLPCLPTECAHVQ